ncbi:MAG: pilus assembly protein N-terminal domain-containing protein [Bryobacterales bacterium]|nr:pilus assembly protein N-terminal domain-containing protein [Bryobacterales bacterium]
MNPRNVSSLLLLTALLAPVLPAQTAPAKEMSLLVGRGELISFERDLNRVVIAEPKIADAVVVSPREVMVNAKGVGKTTLIVWETGAIPMRYNINVTPDLTEIHGILSEIQGKAPGITVTGTKEKLVLTGAVKSVEESKRVEAMAAAHATEVVNMLTTPSAPDPRQILLQVKFASVDRSALSELGFNYFSRNNKTLGSLTTQQFQQPRFSQLQFQDQEFANSTINFADLLNLFIFRPDLNIGATIRALQGRNMLQILAEPNLIAIEGKEASFLAGGEFPFPTLTATTTGGAVAPVVTVQFKKFGIQLGFTPTMTNSGAIHLKVQPEVSSLDFSNAVTLQGFLIPAVAVRRADTEVVLKDGESFAIAGLMDNRVTQVLNRVPGIGDIPIVGHLFRSRSLKKTQDELLVVITPRFVRPVPAGEEVKMPAMLETFLPSADEVKRIEDEKKSKKNKGAKSPAADKPQMVGPTGHQKP